MRKLVCLLLALAASGAALAAGDQATDKAKPSGKKDVVAEALALPPGKVLRSDQQAKYKELKATYEPKLREAADKLAKASESEKHKAYLEMKTLRDEVSDAIAEILKMPEPTTSQSKTTSSSAATPRPAVRHTRASVPHALRASTPRTPPASRARAIRAQVPVRY